MQWLLPSNLDEDLNLFQIIKKTFELYMKSWLGTVFIMIKLLLLVGYNYRVG